MERHLERTSFFNEGHKLFWKMSALAIEKYRIFPGENTSRSLRHAVASQLAQMAHQYTVLRVSVQPFRSPAERQMEFAWSYLLSQLEPLAHAGADSQAVSRLLAETANCMIRYEGFDWKTTQLRDESNDLLIALCRKSRALELSKIVAAFRSSLLGDIVFTGDSDGTVFKYGDDFMIRNGGQLLDAFNLR